MLSEIPMIHFVDSCCSRLKGVTLRSFRPLKVGYSATDVLWTRDNQSHGLDVQGALSEVDDFSRKFVVLCGYWIQLNVRFILTRFDEGADLAFIVLTE